MAEPTPKFLDPEVLNKITRLDLKARHIVEGFVAGMHKSPYHGFSVEFAKHREYAPGDDLKHLDWKVFGRSDRLYVKEYELETNLRAHILLDTSESMEYRGGKHSKLELACYIAASMAYLILRQQDSVGMVCFDKEVRQFVPSSSSLGHMRSLLGTLAHAAPRDRTDLGGVLHAMAERLRHRGLVILISDLFDKPDSILKGLQHFSHKRHDVIVFHVLDEHELTFPFERMTLFEGLEEHPKLLVDPRALRKAYLEEVNRFCETIRRGCVKLMIDYVRISTDQELDVELTKYLAGRLSIRRRLP
ncbi:MAG TPA: DUF58 domain-containing protein [Planctomycetota bacterium]|jgi:uncharacterized protein (DUF58 family)|nr:DUF58 domain-containing protein [Planctomycetota bacterium]